LETILTGSITASDLGNIGKKYYGFISVETEENNRVKVKVAAYTKYDTLDIGRRVHIVAEPLGNTGIITAKSILLAD